MKRVFSLFTLLSGVLLLSFGHAWAYPAAGGKASKSCSACHNNAAFNGTAAFYLIDKVTGENVVRGDTAYIPIHKGNKGSYKLILGGNGKSSMLPKTIGWMLVLPGGITTELPNCIRLLNSGQKFRYKLEENGKLSENDNLTVATQSFFFDGNAGNFKQALYGEIRAALGPRKQGKMGLGTQTLKLVFTP